MSSILKALRKLEEERASRRDGGLDIARDILRRPPSRRRPSPWRHSATISLLTVLLLGAGAWGVIQRLAPIPLPVEGVGEERTVSPPPAPEPVSSPPAAETPFAPPANRLALVQAEPEIVEETIDDRPTARVGEKVSTRPAVPPPKPVSERSPRLPAESSARIAVSLPAPPPRSTAPLSVPAAPAPTSAAPREPESTSAAPVVAPSLPKPADQAPVPVRPSLVVSGIAFHDDPDARLAIVNDLPVMRGTSVEGAMVEEILPDRVRFSLDGKSFEVRMED